MSKVWEITPVGRICPKCSKERLYLIESYNRETYATIDVVWMCKECKFIFNKEDLDKIYDYKA